MANPFLAEIRMFPFNFAPKGWAMCNGQLLPISQNTALFSLVGTNYGGDGKSNFALPNLQGSAPLNWGQGPGLSDYFLGETGGEQSVTLLQTEMPAHSHTANAAPSTSPPQASPAGAAWGAGARGANLYAAPGNAQMNPSALSVTGSSFPHNNMPPYLGLNFCIALQGVYPPRG